MARLVFGDLAGAYLEAAVFDRANLSGADLRQADLTSARLRWAVMIGTNIEGVDLDTADTTGVRIERFRLAAPSPGTS